MKKRILITVSTVLAVLTVLYFLQLLVAPKYIFNPEGRLTGEYYSQSEGNEVIFIGDCEVYETFIPAVLWEKHGISSFVRGSAQQLAWQSYYLLREVYERETPKAVVFNVLALKYGEPQSEEFNRMTLDTMRWSGIKWDAIRASMTEDESMLDYVFPFLRYHSRITQLDSDDLKYMFSSPDEISHSGYLMQKNIVPQTEADSEGKELLDYILPATSMEYLDKIRELCEQNGTELILVKAPTNSWRFWWYDEWDEQICEYARAHGLAYYNLIDKTEDIGIDYSTDTYDAGVHLNVYGAEKTTEYFGKILVQNHGLGGAEYTAQERLAWQARLERYYNERNGE